MYSYWSLQPVASVTIRVTGVVSVESSIVSQIAVFSLLIRTTSKTASQTVKALAGSDHCLICLLSALYGKEICLILVHFINTVLPSL